MGNAETFEVYSYCSNQLILSEGQAVALKLEAVDKAIEYFGHDAKKETLSKILSLSEQLIEFQNEKRIRDTPTKKGLKR